MTNVKNRKMAANAALVTATIIWGSSFFIMKNTLDSIGSFYLLAVRFTIASVLLSIVFFRKYRLINKEYILGGIVLGAFIGSAYVVQTIGLSFTTPGKNAFLTAVYCLIVPFLYWAVTKARPDAYNISAAVICMVGIGLVSINPGAESMFNIGDILTLGGGFLYACHIIAVNRISPGKDIIFLTILQFVSAAVMIWIIAPFVDEFPAGLSTGAWASLAYLGVMCTAVALMLQNVGQKYTEPSTAALLLSLESVFGVIFSIIFAGEQMTFRLVLGFALIFAALVLSEVKPGRRAGNVQ